MKTQKSYAPATTGVLSPDSDAQIRDFRLWALIRLKEEKEKFDAGRGDYVSYHNAMELYRSVHQEPLKSLTP